MVNGEFAQLTTGRGGISPRAVATPTEGRAVAGPSGVLEGPIASCTTVCRAAVCGTEDGAGVHNAEQEVSSLCSTLSSQSEGPKAPKPIITGTPPSPPRRHPTSPPQPSAMKTAGRAPPPLVQMKRNYSLPPLLFPPTVIRAPAPPPPSPPPPAPAPAWDDGGDGTPSPVDLLQTSFRPYQTFIRPHQTSIRPPSDLHQTSIRPPSDLLQTSIRPPSDLHQTFIRPPPDLHQTSFRPPSDLHQTSIRPPSDLPQTSIRPLSDLHQTSTRPPSDLHQTSFRPPSDLHQASFRPPSDPHQASIGPSSDLHQSSTSSLELHQATPQHHPLVRMREVSMEGKGPNAGRRPLRMELIAPAAVERCPQTYRLY
ncbi:unnamed protein product [Gadus morhua 'NCC']